MTRKLRPFLKWAGGKSRLLSALARRVPEGFKAFHEPFLGGGALFFHLAGSGRLTRACLSDINQPLVDTYRGVQRAVDEVIEQLGEYAERHDRDHYYQVRDADSSPGDLAARAARMIYLNRTCYNGLYRENRAGRLVICRNVEEAAEARAKAASGTAWKDILVAYGTEMENKSRV